MQFAWPTKESADLAGRPGGADYSIRVQASPNLAETQLFCGCCLGAVVCRFINKHLAMGSYRNSTPPP